MAQRKIYKVADLSKRTGLSRTTLTEIYFGRGEGIKFRTLDAICKVL